MKKQLLSAALLLATNTLLHTTATAQAITAGTSHSLALCNNGTVMA